MSYPPVAGAVTGAVSGAISSWIYGGNWGQNVLDGARAGLIGAAVGMGTAATVGKLKALVCGMSTNEQLLASLSGYGSPNTLADQTYAMNDPSYRAASRIAIMKDLQLLPIMLKIGIGIVLLGPFGRMNAMSKRPIFIILLLLVYIGSTK